jgi:hypothetical protein
MATDIERLTDEIEQLRQANLTLREQMARIAAPVKSPDDVASALQRTVDNLQSKLASLSNPISNFAVKEFRLETSLAVSITDLGTIEYRLLQPGANVDPSSISKLTLTLVPIEKRQPEGTLSPQLFEPNKELSVVGITGGLRDTLEQNHIYTIEDFRTAAMRAQVRASLIASGTTPQELARFQARAELALLNGVDGAIADRLIAAGIDSLQAVARSSAEGLMLIVVEIDRPQLEQWISAAQTFTGIFESTDRVVRIDTNPPHLFARMGKDRFTDGAIVRQTTTRQPMSMATFRAQLIGRSGYAFDSWSNGVTTPMQTLESPKSTTAQFHLACHSVFAVSASLGGVLLIEPQTGGVPGFPANCYAPGTKIELVAKPEEGWVLKALTITTIHETKSMTTLRTPLAVDGPITAKAAFRRRLQIIGEAAEV